MMPITINTVFKIGEIVYLKTDREQTQRMITGYTVRLKTIIYLVSSYGVEEAFYDFELTNKYDVLKKLIDNECESN